MDSSLRNLSFARPLIGSAVVTVPELSANLDALISTICVDVTPMNVSSMMLRPAPATDEKAFLKKLPTPAPAPPPRAFSAAASAAALAARASVSRFCRKAGRRILFAS